jgi:hypothetical protein
MMTQREWRLHHSVALLPTRTNISQATMADHPYHDDRTVYLVLADLRGKPRRIIAGSGTEPYRGFEVGTQHEFHHDQEGYTFGLLRVVGWFTAANGGREQGVVPTRKLPLGVFK